MYSILKKFKQILLYGGLEKQQYKQISARIDDANRKSIVILSLSCLLFFLVRLSLSYSQVPATNRIAFSCAILLFALLAICNVRIKNRQWVVHLSAYLFLAFYLGVGILSSIGEGSLEERTTLYLVFLAVAPMLYALNAIELICIILPAETLYLFLIHRFQASYPVYATNVGNSLFFAIAGLLLGIYMANMKISGIYNTYLNARAEEIRKLNEDLAKSQKELQKALSAAEQANHAKTTFLNNMSHDIRTPMNAIIGFTSLASSHLENPALVRDYLGKIGIAGHHLLALINDVLDMSRIESGTVKLEQKPLDLATLVDEVRTIVQSGMEEHHLTFVSEPAPLANPVVKGDSLRIHQILLNILGNAMKFTPEGGCVFFHLRQLRDAENGCAEYEFRIRDTGIGMSEEFQKHIFEAFSRENTSAVHQIQGTGLGMAITKNFVDLMGGTIAVQSKEGEGSEFIITLSLQVCDAAELQNLKNNAPETAGSSGISETSDTAAAAPLQIGIKDSSLPDFSGKKILLAEDNELNAEIAVSLLADYGFSVAVVSDGTEAVETMQQASILANCPYDLILMDIQMPRMNGYEATKKIRALENPAIANIPIIAMTANAFEEDRQAAFAAGMNGHLAKPIDVERLLGLLRQIL